MHPFVASEGLSWRVMGSSAARSASSVLTKPSSAMRLRTTLRRVVLSSGLRSGSYAVGCWTMPARVAASGRVRSEAGLEK